MLVMGGKSMYRQVNEDSHRLTEDKGSLGQEQWEVGRVQRR
jgi:hypothetical protein